MQVASGVFAARQATESFQGTLRGFESMDVWHYLNPLDTAACARRFQTADPFPNICMDNFLKPEFARQVLADFPSFEQARGVGKEFRAVNERGKVQVTDSSRFHGAVHSLHDLLASTEFLKLMSVITGIDELLADASLAGGGLHQTGPRGHLDVHLDFNFITERRLHRRLNIILFLNPDWKPEWGGCLELWDKEVRHCHHRLSPDFNRCVVFETNEVSFHGVTAVTCPETESRKSFAAYYYTHYAGSDIHELSHSTIFRARPNEHWKRWVAMPVENLRRQIASSKRSVKSVLKKMVG